MILIKIYFYGYLFPDLNISLNVLFYEHKKYEKNIIDGDKCFKERYQEKFKLNLPYKIKTITLNS